MTHGKLGYINTNYRYYIERRNEILMARKLRVQGQGMIHHVIARGNGKKDIFNGDIDRRKYLDLIRKYKLRYRFKVYAYCLMNNHIHLLLEKGSVNLSKIMQGIQQSYTQYINKNTRQQVMF